MKLLICAQKFSDEQLSALEELGFECVFHKRENDPLPEEYLDAEAVVCFRLFCYTPIERFEKLKMVHTTSAGLDHMPLEYISEKGIRLWNAGGVYSAPMAEFALGGVLQLYKKAELLRQQQQGHVWKQERKLQELAGKRVCIVGSGSIGGENAKRFSAMGCHVTGLCRHPKPLPYFDEVKSISELDCVLEKSDIIILSVPLDDSTRHLMNAERFARVKRGAVLVNIARGQVTDTEAFIKAMETGILSGAVLDVFEEEPLSADSPLWDMENVIVTPHNSFCGEFNSERMFRLIYGNFENFLRK